MSSRLHKSQILAFAAASGALLGIAFLATGARADEFVAETAFGTNATIADGQTSIAVDNDGNPHIANTGDFAGAGVWYSSKAGGVWTHECVHTLLFTSFSSLALDASGSPHLSYSAGPELDLFYAHRDGGAWTIELVDRPPVPDGRVGGWSTIALDAAGDVHIAYDEVGVGAYRVKYARRAAGAWTVEYLPSSGTVANISMALDSNGNPRLSYNEFTTGVADLRYARKVSGVWLIETPDGGAGDIVGVSSQIDVDPLGRAHIVHYDATTQDLKYVRKLGAIWITEVIDDGGGTQTGRYCDIALDADGNPCVSYQYDAASVSPDLRFARRVGGGWAITTVDAGPNAVGRWSAIALDALGNPHISYEDRTKADLKYATGLLTTSVPGGRGESFALAVAPNPAGRAGAVVSYRVPAGGSPAAALAVYDAGGRMVSNLAERLAAREGTIAWDARDMLGRPVSSGVYFLRLTAGGASRTERLVLVR